MQTLALTQGTPQWHAHRAQHFNASDAPAMMGCSPYKSRNDLLRELATGLVEEADPELQRLYSRGHRFEALSRPLAEKIIGEDLYPVVGTEGRLSASFDGLTILEDVAFEHKMLNDTLRAAMFDGCTGADLPLVYQVQMEQQCMVAGCDRVLFMATSWTDDDTLSEERHCWYTANPDLAEKISRGWAQFADDLAVWSPTAAAPVVVAAAVEHLPAVSVRLQGSLAVVSNLEPFGVALRAFVDRIPKRPSTDQDFADTEAACKRLKEAEDRLQQAEDSALASMSNVETMRRMVADFRELARTTRLASEKLVTQRKQQIREEEVQRGRVAFAEHFQALAVRLGGPYIPPITHDFPGVIKGLRTLDSVRNAIDTELARAKIEASALADKVEANLKTIEAAGAPTLFPDKASLVLKAPEDLAAQIEFRLVQERRRQEAERERIRAEEAARLEREAAARAELERQQAAVAAAAIDAALAEANNEQGNAATEMRASTPSGFSRDWPRTAHASGMLPTSQSQSIESSGAVASSTLADGGERPAHITQDDQESGSLPGAPGACASTGAEAAEAPGSGDEGKAAHADERAADTRPTIKLGDICERLGFTVTASFITETLGIKSVGTDKRAVLFAAADFGRICDALIHHITIKKEAN